MAAYAKEQRGSSFPNWRDYRNMINILQQLLGEAWFGTAIAALGIIIGIIVALAIYRASEIGARPVYSRRSFRVIGFNKDEFLQDVEILYHGKRIDRLTRTRLIFWNSGKRIIRGSDIVAEDAVRCELSLGALALEVRVIKHTRDANKFMARIDDNSQNRVLLNFDYLDPKDGAVVEILHTDSVRDPAVKGTIRGVPKGMLDWGSRSTLDSPFPLMFRLPNALKLGKVMAVVFLIFGSVVIIFGIDVSDLSKHLDNSKLTPFTVSLVIIIIGAIYVALGGFFLFNFRRRYPRTLHYIEGAPSG